jgi:hypothetical protein
MWFPHIAIDLVFVLDMVILYFLAIRIEELNEVLKHAKKTGKFVD